MSKVSQIALAIYEKYIFRVFFDTNTLEMFLS